MMIAEGGSYGGGGRGGREVTRRDVLRRAAGAALAGAGALLSSRAAAGDLVAADFRGVALGGYDPVHYFDASEAALGEARYELLWSGAAWRFIGEETMMRFAADPTRFAPAYGAHCALWVAKGRLVRADPLQWDIYAGRLYVKASEAARREWRQDPAGFVAQADTLWPTLTNV